jgi:hypothetical protein
MPDPLLYATLTVTAVPCRPLWLATACWSKLPLGRTVLEAAACHTWPCSLARYTGAFEVVEPPSSNTLVIVMPEDSPLWPEDGQL